jgi:hypothetical protein
MNSSLVPSRNSFKRYIRVGTPPDNNRELTFSVRMDERSSHSFLAWVMAPMSRAEGMMSELESGVRALIAVWEESDVQEQSAGRDRATG